MKSLFSALSKTVQNLGINSKASSNINKSKAENTKELTSQQLSKVTSVHCGELTWDNLEDHLIQADVGVRRSANLINELKKLNPRGGFSASQIVKLLLPWLYDVEKTLDISGEGPVIILITGINGSGKTATCGKLGKILSAKGKKVGFVSADTFRSAANEQLNIWAEKTSCLFYSSTQGSDPAACVYKAIESAKKDCVDILLVDTAGRLHNKQDLMFELDKIKRVIKKHYPKEPRHCLFVLDGSGGQNTLQQVEAFKEYIGISGLIVTKLDGSTKGGIIVALAEKYSLPIYYLGIGEAVDDLIEFDAKDYLKVLFGQ